MAFQAGEIVRVKSGGPELTVLGEEEGKVLCLFFSEELGEFRETALPLIAVETVDAAGDEDPEEDEEESEDGDDEDADEEDEEKPSAKKQRVAA